MLTKIGPNRTARSPGGGGRVGVIPFNGRHWEFPPEKCTLVRHQVYKRVGISLVKIYKSIGKSVIACCTKDAFCGCEKVKEIHGLVIHSYLKIQSVYSS